MQSLHPKHFLFGAAIMYVCSFSAILFTGYKESNDLHLSNKFLSIADKLISQSKYTEAILSAHEAVRYRKNNPMAHFSVGLALYHQEAYNECIKEMTEANHILTQLGGNSTYPAADLYLGKSYLKLKKYSESKKELRLAADSNMAEVKSEAEGILSFIKYKH